MKKQHLFCKLFAAAFILGISSCKKNVDVNSEKNPEKITNDMMAEKGANPDESSVASAGAPGSSSRSNIHYLYTESNATGSNEILMYKINSNGSLNAQGTVATGGAGTGMPLGSQGAVTLDNDREWLYAVNAGSNSISSFKVNNNGSLTLASTVGSRGTMPVSVTVHGNLVYVLNRGSDNIHGFEIGSGGVLNPIPGSGKPLSGTGVDAPQISFTPNGDLIVVTEKATNKLSTFKVKNDGSVQSGVFTNSVGQTPFGFDFGRDDNMIVSNAVGGGAGAGSATSYRNGSNAVPQAVNGARANYQSAPCWVAVTKYGRFAYVTNTASNNISSYYVAPWGGLYLVESNAASTEMGPLDIIVGENNYYVYVVNSGSHSIGTYHRNFFGGLSSMGIEAGLPMGTTGLATN